MDNKLKESGQVSLPRADLDQLLASAARRGAKQALEDIGLHNGEARACGRIL